MSECRPDGVLRAFLDRELPVEELARLSAHLEQCARCSGRCRELQARGERVMELVGALAEPAADVPVARLPRVPLAMPRPHVGRPHLARPHVGRWVAAAAALAAGWAALTLLTPKPVQAPLETHVQAPRAAQMATETAADTPQVADVPAPSQPLRVRAPNRLTPRPLRRTFPPAAAPRATLAGFVALDDDPIDAGVVMRVALAEGQMQADVIYSSDGRPRAIRLVNDRTGK
jgi:hypothetical protein